MGGREGRREGGEGMGGGEGREGRARARAGDGREHRVGILCEPLRHTGDGPVRSEGDQLLPCYQALNLRCLAV